MEEINPKTISKLKVQDGKFSNAQNVDFFPWGFNYTNAENVGLIEDNWYDESVWQTIQEDFIEMKFLGANVVRIHLQYNKFMDDANTPNNSALTRLRELVDIAETNNLYLDITGLGAYRKSDQPDFYQNLSDIDRWNTQALFWENIAEEIANHPSVFAFNLMNEPVVSVGCDTLEDCDWLPGDGFGGFHFVQNITRNSDREFEATIKEWISKMSTAIRSQDNQTPITVGFLNIGNYNRFASDLDYLSPHIYPRSGEISKSIDYIIANHVDVPVVIEETSNLNCNIDELQEFLEGIDGQYDGLMGHYHGKPLAELDNSTIQNALRKNFYQFFIDNNPN